MKLLDVLPFAHSLWKAQSFLYAAQLLVRIVYLGVAFWNDRAISCMMQKNPSKQKSAVTLRFLRLLSKRLHSAYTFVFSPLAEMENFKLKYSIQKRKQEYLLKSRQDEGFELLFMWAEQLTNSSSFSKGRRILSAHCAAYSLWNFLPVLSSCVCLTTGRQNWHSRERFCSASYI